MKPNNSCQIKIYHAVLIFLRVHISVIEVHQMISLIRAAGGCNGCMLHLGRGMGVYVWVVERAVPARQRRTAPDSSRRR
jgi:hypothetical protein